MGNKQYNYILKQILIMQILALLIFLINIYNPYIFYIIKFNHTAFIVFVIFQITLSIELILIKWKIELNQKYILLSSLIIIILNFILIFYDSDLLYHEIITLPLLIIFIIMNKIFKTHFDDNYSYAHIIGILIFSAIKITYLFDLHNFNLSQPHVLCFLFFLCISINKNSLSK